MYHKILSKRIVSNIKISARQKAFVPVEGCCENLFLFDAIIRVSKRRLKPLCLVFVDISKAFDSVSHSPILRAMQSHGLPEPLVEYVQSAYRCLETCIKMDGNPLCRSPRDAGEWRRWLQPATRKGRGEERSIVTRGTGDSVSGRDG